jgi:protein involved in polysaccharide export with SLBB domain/glycosyltransferase involved in cell wall biosynthesis
MAPSFFHLFRTVVARPLHRGGSKAYFDAKPSGRISSPVDLTRPALIILGTRGVPAAHGGFETFAEKLALHMVDRGWHVTVYCQRDVAVGCPLGGQIDVDCWHGIRRVFISVSGGSPMSTMVFDWRCVLHARGEPGLVLVLGYNTACFLPILRMQGRAVLINMDGIEWKRGKWSPPVKLWFLANELIGCMTSSALVADHPKIRDHLKTRCSARKISMIPYGAELIERASTAGLNECGLVPKGFVASIARIEPENSALEIVRAFSRRRRRYLLVCVGALDTERNRYHRQVKAAAGDQVLFPGAIYDKETIRSIRRYAIAYVHGHTVGGTNPSLVEALGAGNAVVARRNHFNVWTAGPEQFYFSSEDECDSLFERLVDDPDTVCRARQAAAQRHRQLFAWPRILESYEALCSRLVAGRRSVVSMLLAVVLTCLQPGPARSEYILGPGDKIEIAVSGSITHRAAINPDGQIAMPQLGSITVAGLSIPAAQNRLRDEYRAKKILLDADVLLEVVEYRPFYISGDVARSGVYPFQPNITVRHAIALAGGLDMVRFRFGENPFIRAVDLRNEYEHLALENLRAHLRQRRLQAELGGKADVYFGDAFNSGVSPKVFGEIAELERQQLNQRLDLFEKETSALKAEINNVQADFNTLMSQTHSEADLVENEQAHLTAMASTADKGLIPANRLFDERRDLAMAKSRYLATQSQTWNARRTSGELQIQLYRTEEGHRSGLLKELQDTSLELENVQSRLKAVVEKFAVTAGARSALYKRAGNEMDVTIFRKVGEGVKQLQASADSDVLAGDVIEVDLKPGDVLGVTAQLSGAQAPR